MSFSLRIANLVVEHLSHGYGAWPAKTVVRELVETLFNASLKTEEGRGVNCTVAFITHNPGNFADDSTRRAHRPVFVALEKPVRLTARSLSKFAQAAPPWASCIAVEEVNGELQISGLFDQEIHYQNALNHEGESRPARPGLFQIEVLGVGAITVYIDRKLLATWNQNALVTQFHDVLNRGPIADRISTYIAKLEKRVKARLATDFPEENLEACLVEAPRLWVQTLSRILLSIRRLKHGGAVLLAPKGMTKDLSINYSVTYDRMETALERRIVAHARWEIAREALRESYQNIEGSIPIKLDRQRRGGFNEEEDAKKAQQGSANFIASLAGVDGLILLKEGLHVMGFGVEIRLKDDPAVVFTAGDPDASPEKLTRTSLGQFGTRHRSMMRYCNRHPGSIGFVISQDGDVRAITKTAAGLVVWENILLQEADAEKSVWRQIPHVRDLESRKAQVEAQLANSQYFSRKGEEGGEEVWLTQGGDPLKLTVNVEGKNSRATVESFFDQDGTIVSQERLSKSFLDDDITLEKTIKYFGGVAVA